MILQTTPRPELRPVLLWVGSSVRTALVVSIVLLLAGAAPAQHKPFEATAEIRIALPGDVPPRVSITPGRERIVLDLPRGAQFPSDFVSSSGGMLREGKSQFSEDRVEISLELALGTLERVDYEPQAIVLQFRSSQLPAVGTTDPQQRYVLGPDDRIAILIHNHQELSPELDITREGWITAPLVGQVKAAGLTPPQLGAKLAEMLSDGFLKKPQVDVSVREYRSQWVVISGEVLKPGRKALRGGTKLKEVLGEAEGFTEDAGEEIQITRVVPGGNDVRTLYISRTDFERGMANPSLSHGDTIDVRRAEYAYIQGEVRESGRLRVERGMTLMRLVAVAGLTDWADRKKIVILYPDGHKQTFNLNRIENNKMEDPVIRGGENVIVKKRFL